MNHDACHCFDYEEGVCPENCYRAQLTADLIRIKYPYPTTWSKFLGTPECWRIENNGRTGNQKEDRGAEGLPGAPGFGEPEADRDQPREDRGQAGRHRAFSQTGEERLLRTIVDCYGTLRCPRCGKTAVFQIMHKEIPGDQAQLFLADMVSGEAPVFLVRARVECERCSELDLASYFDADKVTLRQAVGLARDEMKARWNRKDDPWVYKTGGKK